MKKGVWVIIAWLYIAGGSVWANDSTVWHQGQLVLQNGIELNGDLNYNWLAQVVQYRQGPIIKAYSANQVYAFTYFDGQSGAIRKFVPVDCLVKSGLHRLRILEEIVSGPLFVYREYSPGYDLIKMAHPSAYASGDEVLNKNINLFTYKVSFNGELLEMNVFYRQIWPHLKTAFDHEFKEYTKLTRTNWTDTIGQIRLICWYNSLAGRALSPSSSEPIEVLAGQ